MMVRVLDQGQQQHLEVLRSLGALAYFGIGRSWTNFAFPTSHVDQQGNMNVLYYRGDLIS